MFWLYHRDDSGRLRFVPRSAKSVGYQNGLYSTMPEIFGIGDSASNHLEEKFFSPLDSAASQVSKKLIASGLKDLSTEDRFVWCLFVNSLLERSPTRINEVGENAKEITAKITSELKQRFDGAEADQHRFWERLDILAITNNAVLTGLTRCICDHETIRRFYDMAWVVVRLPKGKDHFLTGDTPVVVNGSAGGAPIHALSLALSPRTLLIMHACSEEFDKEFIEKLTILHSPLIVRQTKRYLVSSTELNDDGNVKYRRIFK